MRPLPAHSGGCSTLRLLDAAAARRRAREPPSLMGTTLIILISVAWLAIALLALAMCRLAARADKSLDEELAERIAASAHADNHAVSANRPAQPVSLDPRRSKFRATGS